MAGRDVKMNHMVKCAMDMYASGMWSGGSRLVTTFTRGRARGQDAASVANSVGIIDSGYRGTLRRSLTTGARRSIRWRRTIASSRFARDLSYPMVVTMVSEERS